MILNTIMRVQRTKVVTMIRMSSMKGRRRAKMDRMSDLLSYDNVEGFDDIHSCRRQ